MSLTLPENHGVDFRHLEDYILGLLPESEHMRIERHVQNCDACRAAVQREQQMMQLMRSTLHRVTQPSQRQLRQLMPAVRGDNRPVWLQFAIQRPIAMLSILLLVFMSGLGLKQLNFQPIIGGPVATAGVPTVTMTATATMESTIAPTATELAASPREPRPVIFRSRPQQSSSDIPSITFLSTPVASASIAMP